MILLSKLTNNILKYWNNFLLRLSFHLLGRISSTVKGMFTDSMIYANNVWSALEFNFNRSAQVKAKWQFFSSTAFNKRHTRPWKRHSVHWAILRLGKSSLKDNSSERRALIGLHLDLYLVWYTYSLRFKRLICALSNKPE